MFPKASTEPNYRLNCGQYVLHRGDTPVSPVMDEVALAISRTDGILHKHGAVDNVTLWANNTRSELRSGGGPLSQEMANDLVVLSGRFPVGELNKVVSSPGCLPDFLRRLETGELQPEPLFTGADMARDAMAARSLALRR